MKILSIDVETTGLDIDVDDVVEIAMVFDDLNKPEPIEQLPMFHCYVDMPRFSGHPIALAMHREKLERIGNRVAGYRYLPPHAIHTAMAEFLKRAFDDDLKINVAGKNYGTFDFNFIRRLHNVNREGGKLLIGDYELGARIMDPASHFIDKVGDRKPPDLNTCLRRAGIEWQTDHSATNDAIAVIRLWRAIWTKL